MDSNQLAAAEENRKHVDGDGDCLLQKQEQEKQKDGGESLTMLDDLASRKRKRGDEGDQDDEDEDEDEGGQDDEDEDEADDSETSEDDRYAALPLPERIRIKKYLKQVYESEGFDFDEFPGSSSYIPVECVLHYTLEREEDRERLTRYATMALKDYNKKHGEVYQFDSLEKANVSATGYFVFFYITFNVRKNISLEARDAGGDSSSSSSSDGRQIPAEKFQALVGENWGKAVRPIPVKAYLCRPKMT